MPKRIRASISRDTQWAGDILRCLRRVSERVWGHWSHHRTWVSECRPSDTLTMIFTVIAFVPNVSVKSQNICRGRGSQLQEHHQWLAGITRATRCRACPPHLSLPDLEWHQVHWAGVLSEKSLFLFAIAPDFGGKPHTVESKFRQVDVSNNGNSHERMFLFLIFHFWNNNQFCLEMTEMYLERVFIISVGLFPSRFPL
jgi:hypothetical protein